MSSKYMSRGRLIADAIQGFPRVIIVEISGTKVAVGEVLMENGSRFLNKLAVETIPSNDNEQKSFDLKVNLLRELLRELKIKPSPAVVCIPSQSVFSKFVDLPPVSPERIGQLLSYEAEQNIPFPINEVTWDYALLDNGALNTSAMLCSIKNANVMRILDMMRMADLDPVAIVPSSVCLLNASLKECPPDNPDDCVLTIDIGQRSTTMCFKEGNKIFMRDVPVAGLNITYEIMKEFDVSFEEAEEMKLSGPTDPDDKDKCEYIIRSVLTRLYAETNRSINFWRSQQKVSHPSKIVLTGGTTGIYGVETLFQRKLHADTEILDAFDSISVSTPLIPAVVKNARFLAVLEGAFLMMYPGVVAPVSLVPNQIGSINRYKRLFRIIFQILRDFFIKDNDSDPIAKSEMPAAGVLSVAQGGMDGTGGSALDHEISHTISMATIKEATNGQDQ